MSSVFPITDDPRYRRYTASAGQTVFPIPFPFLQGEDLRICLQTAPSEYTVFDPADYTLSGANDPAGGTVTLDTGRSAGDIILVLGEAILDRMSSIVRDGRFSSALIDSELDRIRIIEQEFRRDNALSVKVDYGGTGLTLDANIDDGRTLMKQGKRLTAGPDIEAIGDAVEDAKNIVEGWASDIVSQGSVPIYATVIGMPPLNIPSGINALRVNGYYAAGDGGAALYAKADVEPSHPGKFQTEDGAWWEIAEAALNVCMFGARGNYTIGGSGSDDTQAFRDAWRCAIEKGRRVIYVPSGIYLITSTVSDEVCLFVGSGDAVVVFRGMAGLVGFDMLSTASIGVSAGSVDMTYVAEGANILHAIRTPKDSDQYFNRYTGFVFEGNYCRGANRVPEKYSFAWDYSATAWFCIGDCNGLEVQGNKIHGAYDIQQADGGQFADAGLMFDAAGAILSARIEAVEIGPIRTGVLVGNNTFFTMADFDIIGAFDGIMPIEGAVQFNEPKIQNGNINAQRYGIYIRNSQTRTIEDVTIRRHRSGFKGASHDWAGIYLDTVSDFKVSSCTIQPDEGGGEFLGTMRAIYANAANLGVYDDNFIGVGCDEGLVLNNCTGVLVDGIVTAQSNAANVLFKLTGNTRRSSIGKYALVSSFSGTVLSKDGTIVDAINMFNQEWDQQGTGNIVREVTRVNAAADSKKWRETFGTTALTKAVVGDAGASTSYEIVTRSGATVTQLEWRA
ncbi:right-handed parallel beta-helix repeat-containing protein, partial [Agrobacterium pusense]